uniref:Uncharacterized protein n=1 Tax=viral metagenome TaxID=1070528 RepID=A0A6M3IX57_9ZZZZ
MVLKTDMKYMQCPFYLGHLDSVGTCKLNEDRPCLKELDEACETWDNYGIRFKEEE